MHSFHRIWMAVPVVTADAYKPIQPDRRPSMSGQIKMYTLSTCSHCKAAKKFMADHGVTPQCTDVDLLTGDERKKAIEEVKKVNPACSFPTILIGDKIIIGFNEKTLREALGL